MRIMILTAATGGGHNATAHSLAEIFERLGAECIVVDALKVTSRLLDKVITKGYDIGSGKLAGPYSHIYYRMENRSGNSYRFSFSKSLVSAIYKPLYRKILEFDPDFIVSTHVFDCMFLDVIRKKHEVRFGTLGIVTDFTLHPFWEEALRLDYIAIPDEAFREAAIKKGFTDKQIIVSGIPIKPKFAITLDKKELRNKMKLDPDKFTVLIMSGSMGYGNIERIVAGFDAMQDDFQMIVVCGSNEKAYNTLKKRKWRKKIMILGFVSNINELMDASDCILTKPGGISTSEALSKGLPMILANPIPGQEEHNLAFLQEKHVAYAESVTFSVSSALHEIISDSEETEKMKKAIDMLKKPFAANEICDFIMKKAIENKSK